MLVVARKQGERILIGENVWVTITNIRGKVVSVGIDAPPEIKIRREENGETVKEK